MSESQALQQAIDYVIQNTKQKSAEFAMSYHFTPPVGWCNDPNGLCYYNGKAHLFYQYYPYDAKWGKMHWGHAQSSDLVKWQHLPVALAPDCKYDDGWGCFSGSAIVKDNNLYLMYTGVDSNSVQTQCLASSTEGENFVKSPFNPVIGEDKMPIKVNKVDFRDPFVFKHNDNYYCLVGAKYGDYGNILLYKSSDLFGWQYVGNLLDNVNNHSQTNTMSQPSKINLDGVFECPALAEINGNTVLICSPQNLPTCDCDYQNIHSSVYMCGSLNYDSGEFSYQEMHEIDSGFDFYAPQTFAMPDGRTIMIAWMQQWNRLYPTNIDGWAGSMTVPRELSIINGKLYQQPIKELQQYRTNKVAYDSEVVEDNSTLTLQGIEGKIIELSFDIDINSSSAKCIGVQLMKGGDNKTLLYYDKESGTITLDRTDSGIALGGSENNTNTRSVKVTPNNGKISLQILLDNISMEVFINGGQATMTANVYTDLNNDNIAFYCTDGKATLRDITKYDIIVK